MSRARFVPNKNIERELVRHTRVRDALQETTDQAAAEARRLAGSRARIRQSVESEVGTTADGGWVGVVRTAGKWGFIGRFHEFGTVKMSPRPFLRPAVESVLRGRGRYTPGKRPGTRSL